MPHRILHLLGTAQPEGTSMARMILALARGLDPKRYRVHACFIGGDGPLVAELEAADVPVRVINWWRGARDPAGAWRFWRGLQGETFAIAHLHTGGRSVRWLAHWATGASIVVHLHGRVLESRGPSPMPIPVQGGDVVIANSRTVAEWVIGLRPHVVYPGVQIPEDDGRVAAVARSGTGSVLGTAGRLVPIKGMVYLIRALSTLRAQFPEVHLEIAGQGPQQTELEQEVKLLGLEDCVRFLGWRADLTPVLARWDVFVQPSLEEGFGMAILEAMAAGLPVVASAVGGVREIVRDGQTGWLVPPKDPIALAERLSALLRDPEQRRSMGAAGRARAREDFSVDRMVAEISKIYGSILESRGPR